MTFEISWRVGRILWRRLAETLHLPHLVPLLRDEWELSLLLYLLGIMTSTTTATSAYSMTHFWGVVCLLGHLVRGPRWQLMPVYIAMLSSFFLPSILPPLVTTILMALCLLLSLALCFLGPIQPPIVVQACPDKVCVGVQDIVLTEPVTGNSFIARAYYPMPESNHTNHKPVLKLEYFIVPLLSIIIPYVSLSSYSQSWFVSVIQAILASQLGLYMYHDVSFSEYVPEGYPLIQKIAKFGEIPWVLFSHLTSIRLHCREDALIAERAKNILLFYPGLCCSRTVHASACMEAAHDGYFVVCLESSDRTPPLSVAPPSYVPKAYKSYEEYEQESLRAGLIDPAANLSPNEIGHTFRYGQMNIRARESQAILDFLKKHSKAAAGGRVDTVFTNSKNIYLGYSHLRSQYSLSNLLSWKWWCKSTLRYFNNHDESLFWSSLRNHQFESFEPLVMGHSFGGATVLHLAADDGKDAKSFRSQYPIRAVVAHDPWTEIPLSSQVKNMPADSFDTTPVLIMTAEHFAYFNEYNIVNACKHVINLKILDAGHHSFNEFAFLAPLVGVRMRNHGYQDAQHLLATINRVSLAFLASVRQAASASSRGERGVRNGSLASSSGDDDGDNDGTESDQGWVKLGTPNGRSVASMAKFDKQKCLDIINAAGTFSVLQIKP